MVFDCAAVSDSLIESELFGHEKGAFTGAVNQRIGCLERAHNGTLFLDEIDDLALDLQPKLLRAIEDREFRRLGASSSPVAFDARIVAASKKDLWAETQAGRFREDLYFRLSVFTVSLPPAARPQGGHPAPGRRLLRRAAVRAAPRPGARAVPGPRLAGQRP